MNEPDLLGPRRIRELLRAHRVMLTKSLGQNFVIDPNTIRKVVTVADIAPTDDVLEIGAGAGSLTLELARSARSVTAIEIDDRLRPILDETVGRIRNVDVRYSDILDLDVASINATKVVANLPYNIAAQTVIKLLQEAPQIRSICVMTQREVGERLAAAPGSKIYGLTSVIVAFYGDAQLAGRVSRNVFFPTPKVDSALVRIDRRQSIASDVEQQFLRVVRTAFGQRRKTIGRSLAGLAPAEVVDGALEHADIDRAVRPEVLSVDDFVRLARALG